MIERRPVTEIITRAAPTRLDEAGRCCGRKPLVYRRDRHLFCDRCCRAFDYDGFQISNWAWKRVEGSGELMNVRHVVGELVGSS